MDINLIHLLFTPTILLEINSEDFQEMKSHGLGIGWDYKIENQNDSFRHC